MTVKELIEQLQTMDPELYVFTDGYEGGYEDVVSVDNVREIALNYHDEWYYGPHIDAEDEHRNTHPIVKGIIL